MKIELTPAYILHHRDYRESSLLLEIFSREHGRISLIAKGAKRNKKQKGVDFNLYQKYLVSWVAKSELGTLTDIEFEKMMQSLKPEQMMAGFYMNEIVLRLLHKHESHPELFDAYDAAIFSLLNDEPENIVLRYFEKVLLQSLGYGLVLESDVETGEKIAEDKEYCYQLDYGPSSISQEVKSGVKISGEALLQIDNETLSGVKNITEAKKLLKSILNKYLGAKPLASRQLYQAYIQNKKAV